MTSRFLAVTGNGCIGRAGLIRRTIIYYYLLAYLVIYLRILTVLKSNKTLSCHRDSARCGW